MNIRTAITQTDPAHTITQNICGMTEDLSPRLNPLGCFRGIVEDVFKAPVYIIFYKDTSFTFHSFEALRDCIYHDMSFTQVIASKSLSNPLPDEDNVTLTPHY